jgi:alpha-amylase
MKNISLTFNVHHPVQFKKYRFFDIGNDNYYYDDFENERLIKKAAEDYYLPTNQILANLLRKYQGQFKVAFSISGTSIDLFTLYAPEVIESFQKLASTGCVEFIGETYAHSLVSLKSREEFRMQTEAHSDKIYELFGQRPKVFENTGLIYSDCIGEMAGESGYNAVLTEGVRHILKSRSPNHLYNNPYKSELKILLNNNALSENLEFRFSNPEWTGWPADEYNYLSLLNSISQEEEIVNLVFDYHKTCRGQKQAAAAYDFLESFPRAIFEMTEFRFMNPSELICCNHSVAPLSVPETISAAPFDKGVLPYLGNDLQKEAFVKLYEVMERVGQSPDRDLRKDWLYLQTSDHFLHMAAELYHGAGLGGNENPYDNFYEAFMNYMNILSDFTLRASRSVTMLQTDFAAKKFISRMAI